MFNLWLMQNFQFTKILQCNFFLMWTLYMSDPIKLWFTLSYANLQAVCMWRYIICSTRVAFYGTINYYSTMISIGTIHNLLLLATKIQFAFHILANYKFWVRATWIQWFGFGFTFVLLFFRNSAKIKFEQEQLSKFCVEA